MNSHVIKTIFIGAALGAALFLMPFFLLKAAVFLILIGIAFRFFGRHRYYRGPVGWAYADKIRGMSDEDYEDLKNRWSSHRGRCGGRRGGDDEAIEPSKGQEA